MNRQLAVGDRVLFYGRTIDVMALIEKDGVTVAEVADAAGLKRRDEAAIAVNELRKQQLVEGISDADHKALAEKIKEQDAIAREAMFRVGIRAELLSFWDERDVWVSDGRILSDAQQEQFKQLVGKKVAPDAQRAALVFLESKGA